MPWLVGSSLSASLSTLCSFALRSPPHLLPGCARRLDFRNEAQNAAAFKESLKFLGYVDVPDAIPELTTRRAMGMEWVHGRHLSDLDPEEAMRMTYMSCEAVTAGLVLTGLVHADPHEGNIMLADDGRLVFLDFGLMSVVEEDIMEAFASGIQCVLSKDYRGLVQAFKDTGFIGNPIEWRAKEADPWQTSHPDGDDLVGIMAKELQERMDAVDNGGSRFGAMSVVLGDMGYFWCMYTPPYIILLIRTFLTLEGIAGQVDPNFNIYEVALPWAVQRALSPSTASARQTLRSSLLAADNTFQWERVEMLIEQQRAEEAEARDEAKKKAKTDEADDDELPEATSARARLMAQEAGKAQLDPALAAAGAEAQAAQAATPLEALTTVLGSKSGTTLRRIFRDVDSTSLMIQLASPSARDARRLAASKIAEVLYSGIKSSARKLFARGKAPNRMSSFMAQFDGKVVPTNAAAVAASAKSAAPKPQKWPESEESARLEARATARAKKTGKLLLRSHAERQVDAGWRGVLAVGSLCYVTLRVGLAALAQTVIRTSGKLLTKLLPRAAAAGLAAATASVLSWGGGELCALGQSWIRMGEEIESKKLALLDAEKGSTGEATEDSQKKASGDDVIPATA